MKASVFMTIYNKNDCLPNTLYSISKQEVSFPLEVCIVDDGSDVDPEPIIRKFLPEAKYKRLGRVPFVYTLGKCLGMMDSDSDIIIVQGADVMCLQKDVYERLCLSVQPQRPVFAEVRNVSVGSEVYKDFERNALCLPYLMEQYNQVPREDIYSGSGRPGGDWLFFLGAMKKEDWISVGLETRCCDVVTLHRMRESGFEAIFLDHLKAVHQKHPPAHGWPCPLVDTCEYWCMRKLEGLK